MKNALADLAAMLADFGDYAAIGTATVRGIFDNAYGEALMMAGTTPTFVCAAADVSGVLEGAAVTIGGAAYTVAAPIKINGGVATLQLMESDA